MFEFELAKLDSIFRKILIQKLPPKIAIKLYSSVRPHFLKQLIAARPPAITVPPQFTKTLWGIPFRSPLFNAAGMFKTGEGYEVCSLQGAGAFLAGTSTGAPREGNIKRGIKHPFVPYPESRAASNFMGLPNPGDLQVSATLSKIKKIPGCPVGASIAGDAALPEPERLELLIRGLHAYQEAGVDFIETNESCPNTEAHDLMSGLEERLKFIAQNFLINRKRNLPVILKLSVDTDPQALKHLIPLTIALGFDGLNLGNTSTQYPQLEKQIADTEKNVYRFFTESFGGGVSGFPLKQKSLLLIQAAAGILKEQTGSKEFHLIRTGGIETKEDLEMSLNAGASLVQWYTGYFEAFARNGHAVMRSLYNNENI